MDSKEVNENSVKSRKGEELPKKIKMSQEDERIYEEIFKGARVNTIEEKFDKMCQKYIEMYKNNRKNEAKCQATENKCTKINNVLDHTKTENQKLLLAKGTLENLCRELQKQNKALKEEQGQFIKEAEQRHRQAQTKFNTTLNELTTVIEKSSEKTMKLREENIDITTKLKNLCEQVHKRDEQLNSVMKHMESEKIVLEKTLEQRDLKIQALQDLAKTEREALLIDIEMYKKRCTSLEETTHSFRGQMEEYKSKYDEFHNVVKQSNEIFDAFNSEVSNLLQKLQKVETANSLLKQKLDASNAKIIEMVQERQVMESDINEKDKKVVLLTGLCRTLQNDRSKLHEELKKHEKSPKLCDEIVDIKLDLEESRVPIIPEHETKPINCVQNQSSTVNPGKNSTNSNESKKNSKKQKQNPNNQRQASSQKYTSKKKGGLSTTSHQSGAVESSDTFNYIKDNLSTLQKSHLNLFKKYQDVAKDAAISSQTVNDSIKIEQESNNLPEENSETKQNLTEDPNGNNTKQLVNILNNLDATNTTAETPKRNLLSEKEEMLRNSKICLRILEEQLAETLGIQLPSNITDPNNENTDNNDDTRLADMSLTEKEKALKASKESLLALEKQLSQALKLNDTTEQKQATYLQSDEDETIPDTELLENIEPAL